MAAAVQETQPLNLLGHDTLQLIQGGVPLTIQLQLGRGVAANTASSYIYLFIFTHWSIKVKIALSGDH